MFSKKATKIDKIFTVNLTLCSKCQIDGEDFVNFCGLLRKHELYKNIHLVFWSILSFKMEVLQISRLLALVIFLSVFFVKENLRGLGEN